MTNDEALKEFKRIFSEAAKDTDPGSGKILPKTVKKALAKIKQLPEVFAVGETESIQQFYIETLERYLFKTPLHLLRAYREVIDLNDYEKLEKWIENPGSLGTLVRFIDCVRHMHGKVGKKRNRHRGPKYLLLKKLIQEGTIDPEEGYHHKTNRRHLEAAGIKKSSYGNYISDFKKGL